MRAAIPLMNTRIFHRISLYLEMIKFSHSLFALPFALTGMLLAANGLPNIRIIILILTAMVSARTTAMLLNRIIDARIDALNPRTSGRAIPSGIISIPKALIITLISGGIFILCAYLLNWLCLLLSPIPLAVFVIYPYTKRFTRLSHFLLGTALGMAPVGAWIAVTAELPGIPILILGLAVLFWTAGFDIIYAIQDIEFDRGAGLKSIPEKFGIKGAFFCARILHVLSFCMLLGLYFLFAMGYLFLAGIFIVASLLFYEHLILKENFMENLQKAFFTVNIAVSTTVFLFAALDISLG